MTDHPPIVVFLGPSLPVEEARAILDAEYLPPVACGDVYAAMRRRPAALGIIDGMFGQIPAVWHKEILHALSQGTPVLGAASMGALRAAELGPLGMEGLGAVYRAYASGAYEDDDEVAVAHGPAALGFRPLSEAMVNIRHGLAAAQARGLISAGTAGRLVEAAKRTFYPERSWPALLADGRRLGVPADELARLDELVRTERPNVKRDDAIALLRRLAELREEGLAPHRPAFDFNATTFWKALVRMVEEREGPGGEEHPAAALRDHLRVATFNRSPALREALLAVLAVAEAERRGLAVTEEAVADEKRHLQARRPGLRRDDAHELAMQEAVVSALVAELADELPEWVRLALLARGEHAEVRAAVGQQRRWLRALDGESPQAAEELQSILTWYARRHRLSGAPLEQWAQRLGFPTARRFLDQLIVQYRTHERPAAAASRTTRPRRVRAKAGR